jgi:hypothetical protein
MGPTMSCICEELHQGHICELTSNGDLVAVEHVTNRPTVYCENCGIEANSAKYVCSPASLAD